GRARDAARSVSSTAAAAGHLDDLGTDHRRHGPGRRMSALEFDGVSFSYPERQLALLDVNLNVEPSEVLLVVGASGSGKSTLLRCANGLVPHASGGLFAGDVIVFGRSTRSHHPRELADVIGFVGQDPEAQFVIDHVENDIAFVLENLGVPEAAMRRRV